MTRRTRCKKRQPSKQGAHTPEEAFGKPPSASNAGASHADDYTAKKKNAHLFHGLCLSYEYLRLQRQAGEEIKTAHKKDKNNI